MLRSFNPPATYVLGFCDLRDLVIMLNLDLEGVSNLVILPLYFGVLPSNAACKFNNDI